MEPQLGTNTTTWYVIFPILLIALAGTIWFIVKMKTVLWKKIVLSIVGLFSFLGFAGLVLGIYYQTSKVFSGSFNFYAYSVLAPEQDPFDIPEGDYDSVLATFGVYKKDGKLKVLHVPNSKTDYGAYIFSQGKWIVVDINDNVITIPEDIPGSEPHVTKTSLWWALTKDLYRLNESVK
ncbi:MAG: hypothetical protein PHH01_03885 [Patescibacteria group bacterium]|nr:hypothetical protein [Patescibacteria group bacterium]